MSRYTGTPLRIVIALIAIMEPAAAQHYQNDFAPAEFRARWGNVFDEIGANALALVQGAGKVRGFNYPRQYNNFFYLSGIETPHAYLLLDGSNRKVVLFLPARDEKLERSEGKTLSAADVDLVKRLTGVDDVRSSAEMTGDWMREFGDESTKYVYLQFSPSEGLAESRHEILAANQGIADDPWDGRAPREAQLLRLMQLRNPHLEVRDLTPVMDVLRTIKSAGEIALVRRASQLAGLGLIEAMRSTEPGVFEFQLDAAARYIFLLNGARLEGYRSITASGTQNINNGHYFRNDRKMQDGDMVLMDFAPDYHYYVSDVGRMWPVNGTFNAWQRELLGFVLSYHKAILRRIRPGVTPQDILDEVSDVMEAEFDRFRFSKPIYEAAARRMVSTGGGAFSHTVGMAVHDVGHYKSGVLQPGLVFSVDPQLRVPEEDLYLRYEDTVVVTDDGVENFTDFLPMELDEIEALVQEKGIVQMVPPAH